MRPDPHSFCDDDQPRVTALGWRARFDFTSRTIEAEALLTLAAPASGPLDLDTRDLTILSVTDGEGRPLVHRLDAPDPIRGARLRIELPELTGVVRVAYRTAPPAPPTVAPNPLAPPGAAPSPTATALHWVPAPQTAGGQHPFVFSQCQMIFARSLVPLQDTPSRRITFEAELTVPAELRALMAAEHVSRRVEGAFAVEKWRMERPVPPYLLAIAAGDLASAELGPRSRVWAEPSLLARAAHELSGIDALLLAAERLFSPYPWGRFDAVVLPHSFPYGGMENPTLTFLAPTLLVGDHSLVTVVAHELAHAWTGNLVTAASAEHFWINEGFTVFAERRLVEELEGREAAALHAALGRRGLDEALAALRDRPELTCLRTRLEGIGPDESSSVVPYEKGYLLLRALEDAAGRRRFDAMLRAHVERHAWRSLTTEQWVSFVVEALPEACARIDLHRWLFQPGLPDGAPRVMSRRYDELRACARVHAPPAGALSPVEWQLYLDALGRPLDAATCARLDGELGLSRSPNPEVLVAWTALAATADHAPAAARAEELVGQLGRMKYLKPLYLALATRPTTRERVGPLFRQHRDRYHPIARQVIETILRQHGIATSVGNPVSLRRR